MHWSSPGDSPFTSQFGIWQKSDVASLGENWKYFFDWLRTRDGTATVAGNEIHSRHAMGVPVNERGPK